MNRCPPLVKDIYFDAENLILPYTEAAAAYKKKTYRGSVANMTVPEEKQTMFLPDVIEEEEEDIKPSHHTSTISLTNDSPLCERRLANTLKHLRQLIKLILKQFYNLIFKNRPKLIKQNNEKKL